MNRKTLFIDVVVPLSLPNLFTYRVPFELNEQILVGQRVVVQFGKSKLYTALVRKIHETPPKHYTAKYIESIVDETPIVNEIQFKHWEWMADYYMCNIGDVMNAALPSALKLSSETKIILNPDAKNLDEQLLNDKEQFIVDALHIQTVLTMDEVSQIASQKSIHHIVKSLIDKGFVLIYEELKEKFKPKVETFVKLSPQAKKSDFLNKLIPQLEKKAFKQLEILLAFLKLTSKSIDSVNESNDVEVSKSELLKHSNASDSALKSMAKKNIFVLEEKEIGRFAKSSASEVIKELSEYQTNALTKINEAFEIKDVVLLHGVTSSGKTEVYVKLIEKAISEGKQVLYLLPEIALTTQIINRLRKYFGDSVGVYHSRFNENERVEVYKNIANFKSEIANPKSQIILGARSALFLPFSNLGLIIVDEEHDTSYKQHEPAPRYNARDSAIVLAQFHKAKTILGSATPSVESFYNASENKYALVEMTKRFGDIQMPEIIIADVKEEKRKKLLKSHFSSVLLDNIKLALDNKEQIILFQNRRGFAPYLECDNCAWTPQCKNCDVSLTLHKSTGQMICHYCGYTTTPPSVCSACGGTYMQMKSFGTEKIEEELQIFFPNSRIHRMDLDSTRSKYAHQQIIHDFESQNIDILVGTQMVTKGLDFDHVAMVGILDADSMMNFPDFRSYERSFQLMMQVSGRAGRKHKRGKVIIQTKNPSHEVITHVLTNNYDGMYKQQIIDRKNFHYPPFYKLIELTMLHKSSDDINAASEHLSLMLKKKLGNRVIGPQKPLIGKIRNNYLKKILIKVERESSVSNAKKIINDCLTEFKTLPTYRSVRVYADVDLV